MSPRFSAPRSPVSVGTRPDILRLWACFLLLTLAGCGTPAGVLFPPLPAPVVFPPPPDAPRIVYVGQLRASDDLKPARSGLENLGQALFGRQDAHAMLTPYALAVDDADRLFIADSNAQMVHVYDLKTRQYQQWRPPEKGPRLAQPVGIAWVPAAAGAPARLLVADSVGQCLHAFDPAGKYLGEFGRGLLQRPCGLVADPATGRILVADSAAHQVVVLEGTGQLVARLGRRGLQLGEFNFPTNVALDRQGRLYVSDSLNFRVQLFSAGPFYLPLRQVGRKGDLPGYFTQPKGVAVDSENHLLAIDAGFEAIQIFDSEGRLLLYFGEEGHGPGQFWLPTCLTIDRKNRIYVADSYNRRIQVFDYLPEPTPAATLPATRP